MSSTGRERDSDVRASELPENAFLRAYLVGGGYADCYCVEVPQAVSQARFVEAFYTTPLFKLERMVLALFAARPSTDEQARALAAGELPAFAAWNVERRNEQQLLLCDFGGRTRSWLMAVPADGATRLYFGSAVVAVRAAPTGRPTLGPVFGSLISFHKLYSRLLLAAAARRLTR